MREGEGRGGRREGEGGGRGEGGVREEKGGGRGRMEG